MAKKTKLLKTLFLIALAFFFSKCANQLPPTGGPVDKIPPEIIDSYPTSGTTNFSDNKIEFTFSEYVDKRSVKDAIFISPKIPGEKEFSWSGKTLEITFEKDSLLPNTTYSITVGTDVKDINAGNRMAEAFTLFFSTGNKIDRGEIKGKIFADNPSGVLIFAYKESLKKDNPLKYKPNYISQAGKDGRFTIGGLANDTYKVLGVKDKFFDLIYNIGEDYYGIPFKKVAVTQEDSLVTNVNFFLTKEDTTAPTILEVTMTDRNHLQLKFSEPIDSSKLTNENFYFFDSTDAKRIPVNYWYKRKTKSLEYFLAFRDTLNTSNENYLIAENILDKGGNKLNHVEVPVAVSEKPDTNNAEIQSLFTDYSNKINPFDPNIFVYLSDAVDTAKARKGIEVFLKDSVKQKIQVKFLNAALIQLTLEKVKSKEEYRFTFDLRNFVDAAGNKGDTIISKKLTAMNKLDFSGAEGTVFIDSQEPIVVKLRNVNEKSICYSQTLKDEKKFKFNSVIPGKYLLWAFEDKNQNGKYDYGKVEPYELSERFQFYPDTLNLRARWPVGDIVLEFGK